ncbi:hypothetical protein AAF712_015824 [Marasmius tenuissimus]|uniref:Uncharacterized protein n=1 Tax=Marasmius tenuissimus TaxID=585030 RepID=A0ABR2ZAN5_9AGAR
MPPDTREDHRITRTPSSQSCHEFAEAIAPILDKYLSDIQDQSLKSTQTRLFMTEALSYWFAAWPVPERIAGSRGRVRLLKKELAKSILHGGLNYVFRRHRAEREGNPLTYPYPQLGWQEAMEQAITGSGFERWANKEYVAELRERRRAEYAKEKKDFDRFINPPGVSFYGKTPKERFERLIGAYWWIEDDFPHIRDFLHDEEEADEEDEEDEDDKV